MSCMDTSTQSLDSEPLSPQMGRAGPFSTLGGLRPTMNLTWSWPSAQGPWGMVAVMAIADILLAHVLCQTIGTVYPLSPLSIPEILGRVEMETRSSADIFGNQDSYGEGVKPPHVMSHSV